MTTKKVGRMRSMKRQLPRDIFISLGLVNSYDTVQLYIAQPLELELLHQVCAHISFRYSTVL